MKLTLALLTMLLLFIAPAFSELTPADLKEIRAMLNAEITDVKKEIAASEKRMKEHVSQEIGKVDIKISEMDKRLNHIFSLVITLIALIAVVRWGAADYCCDAAKRHTHTRRKD